MQWLLLLITLTLHATVQCTFDPIIIIVRNETGDLLTIKRDAEGDQYVPLRNNNQSATFIPYGQEGKDFEEARKRANINRTTTLMGHYMAQPGTTARKLILTWHIGHSAYTAETTIDQAATGDIPTIILKKDTLAVQDVAATVTAAYH
ncbi:hypothetical protein M1466_01520 [Candidatus Dependentiae bacterium]|nr:hypothetical protein [Candidatus Dependentiae bacterium]